MNGDVIFGGRLSAIVIFLVSITNCTAKTKSTSMQSSRIKFYDPIKPGSPPCCVAGVCYVGSVI